MKPKVIAWSKGLTVIPFENVICVKEDFTVDGMLNVHVAAHSGASARALEVSISSAEAVEFVDKYNIYLAAVEGLQMQVKDEDIPLVQDDYQPGLPL